MPAGDQLLLKCYCFTYRGDISQMLEGCMHQKHLSGMCYLTAIKVQFFPAIKCHKLCGGYLLSQKDRNVLPISSGHTAWCNQQKRIMLHSFLAVKYHVGWLEEKCLSQEAVSLEIASSVVWSEAQGSYWKGRKRLTGNQPSWMEDFSVPPPGIIQLCLWYLLRKSTDCLFTKFCSVPRAKIIPLFF